MDSVYAFKCQCFRNTRHTVTAAIKKISVALVRERTIPTERPPLVGDVSAKLLRIEDATWSASRISTDVF
jgi:hypothetical protein